MGLYSLLSYWELLNLLKPILFIKNSNPMARQKFPLKHVVILNNLQFRSR